MTTCASCGKDNAPHARFCQVCGTALSPAAAEPEPVPHTGTEPLYAGFWIRALAFIIDGIIVFTGSILLGLASFGTGLVLSIVLPWLYEALMVASTNRATLGKMALGLEVTDENGQQLSFTHSTGRHFAKYVSAFLLCAGYIIAAFTERKQALHDLIVNTYVVRNYR